MSYWIPFKEWHFRIWSEIQQAMEEKWIVKKKWIDILFLEWLETEEINSVLYWIKKILNEILIEREVSIYDNNETNIELISKIEEEKKLNIEEIYKLMQLYPLSGKAWNINMIIVDNELKTKYNKWITTWYWKYPNVIISLNEIKKLLSSDEKALAISGLVAHELWHIFWAGYRTFNIANDKTFCHCNWEKWNCIMQPTTLLPKMKSLGEKWFCKDCTDEILLRQKYIEELKQLSIEKLNKLI